MKNIDYRWFLAGTALVLLIILFWKPFPLTDTEPEVFYIETDEEPAEPVNSAAEIAVHVAGAVDHPGVYKLELGKRVDDALQLAGVKAEADIDMLNRAAVLADGQKIVVPFMGDTSQENKDDSLDSLVDLNQADLQQLMELPGIGTVKAQSILDYREQKGFFQTIEEVQQVNGIGENIFNQIKDKIKV